MRTFRTPRTISPMPPTIRINITSVLNSDVRWKWMSRFAITPARMNSAPAPVSTRPANERPSKNRMPMPNSSGISVMPKLRP